MASSVLTAVAVDYPSADGKPVAESDFQLTPLVYVREALRIYYRKREDVYVAGNLLIYYEEGNKAATVAPDVFVVVGASNHERTSYLLWQERKVPDYVLEITSRSTRDEDQGRKRELYRALGVMEYWQYDPTGDYLQPQLQGLELVAGQYVGMPCTERADGTLVMASGVLGLELRVTGRGLRFHDRESGRDLLSHAESCEAQQQAEERWQRENQARRRAETARRAAEARLTQEAAARRAAEARIAELESLLREGGADGAAR